jgi:hypothetical protein
MLIAFTNFFIFIYYYIFNNAFKPSSTTSIRLILLFSETILGNFENAKVCIRLQNLFVSVYENFGKVYYNTLCCLVSTSLAVRSLAMIILSHLLYSSTSNSLFFPERKFLLDLRKLCCFEAHGNYAVQDE